MSDARTAIASKPMWVDLGSTDPAGSRDFYSRTLGWQIDVSDDPQYGGYAVASLRGGPVAGMGPSMAPGAPSAWSVYIGTADVETLASAVAAAGGTVVMPPFAVGDQGRMAVFQDPAGAFLSAWEPNAMQGFGAEGEGTYAWAELNARGAETTEPFYSAVFGWTAKHAAPEGAPPYTEFQLDGHSVAGAMEMSPMVPAEVPSYWLVYFGVDDVDAAAARATGAGAHEIVAPQDFPGGRFAILSDPQGAAFGLLRLADR